MTYNLCKALIEAGRMTADKLDVYFAAGRLTAEEYAELIGMLNAHSSPIAK